MIVEPADRDIVKWAVDHSVPCYYASESGLPAPCLKLQCGHVTAFFCRGQLTRLWAQADYEFVDQMFAELTEMFRLCVWRQDRPIRVPA